MTAFVVIGAVIGAVTLLAIVIIAPSRRVRNEPKLPMRTQLEILLRGRHIDALDAHLEPSGPSIGRDEPVSANDNWRFDTAQIQSLRELDIAREAGAEADTRQDP